MSINSIISDLLIKGSGEQLEIATHVDIDAALRTICAFLNGNGGWFLMGPFKQDNAAAQLNNIVDQIQSDALQRIFPQPLIDVRHETYKENIFILSNVISGSRQPYSFDKKYYVRSGIQTKAANEDEISLLLRTSNSYVSTWEKMMVFDGEVEDLDNQEINNTINFGNLNNRANSLPKEPFEFLSYFQLVDGNRVTNGAMILFGKEPIRFLPQSRVRITLMPHGRTGSRYSDSRMIENNLFVTYTQALEFLVRYIPQVSSFEHDRGERDDVLAIPFQVLDEALVNALVHRDYGNLSGEVVINFLPECLEIINPGEMPDSLVVMKSQIQPHHSILRNPNIAHMFFLRQKMEKVGRGLSLIYDELTKNGMRAPEWTCENGFTVLRLFMTTVQTDLNERAFQFLSHINTGQEFSREQYQESFQGNISERTARNDIALILEGKWIKRIGDSYQTRYVRTSKELPSK
jgi:ATP-dependent DNA helicase RecG